MRYNIDYSKLCPTIRGQIYSSNNNIIPVIVTYKTDRKIKEGELSSLSNKLNRELPIINGCACEMSINSILKLTNDPDVEFISYDSKVFAVMDVARDAIGADFISDTGYTGKDVTVAIIDTGISPHMDLIYPNSRIAGFKDFVNNESRMYDDNGHGTHCAGILAGSGYASKGKYKGIAPEANILSIKVLDENGNGNTSDILSTVQWIIDNKEVYKTRIINFSLGAIAQSREKRDPLVKAANRAIENNFIVVAAVGNSGPLRNTILSPATSRHVISVGALDDKRTPELNDDVIAEFSSRGPTFDRIKKPDLIAPGVNIMSLSNTNLKGYTNLSGTSMSAPMVSGAAALLLNENPNYTHFDIKRKLLNACSRIKASSYEQGAGVLDISRIF
ncbi:MULTISPECIES: S8 family peptidase [unclassified Sedimentibacter]|uniref:S8 family peptidase n=1 Tax=unclassified Sedimentibacter TaxID=2649220 RepID=UPI0027DF5E9F|nr:S8 family peptidase [Sedimentibacter sp. MB35-C1]WMJ77718.1 S8 family peptidase [Sedimentibacter sp. MB35-C1]